MARIETGNQPRIRPIAWIKPNEDKLCRRSAPATNTYQPERRPWGMAKKVPRKGTVRMAAWKDRRQHQVAFSQAWYMPKMEITGGKKRAARLTGDAVSRVSPDVGECAVAMRKQGGG